MAIVRDNLVTQGFIGMLGDLVFRNVGGKTVVSRAPRSPQRQSELQQKNRNRFREATAFAKACMLDPQKKEYYWIKARKMKLPNAYTAAITDFMRKPKIDAVKPKGQRVVITAGKEGFPLAAVDVIVSDANGSINATYNATPVYAQWNAWEAHLPVLPSGPDTEGQKIIVVAKDQAGNIATFLMTD